MATLLTRCGRALLAGSLVALIAAAPAKAGAPAFASFGANSEAAAVVFKVTYSGFASLFPIVDLGIGHVSASVDSRPNARGYAAAADPGQAIQSLGALGVPMPAYPYMARGEYPGATPRVRTTAGEQAIGPGTASGLVSEVRAAEGPAVEAVAQTASFDAPGAITIGSASTRTTLNVSGSVHGRTEVVLHDVVIAGSLAISTVRSVVESAAGGSAGSATGSQKIELSGVTLAGQAATIDDTGVHVPGQDLPASLGDTAALFQDPLGAAGISVRTGKGHLDAAPDGTSVVAGVQGLLVSWTAPDGSVTEYRLAWAAQTLGASLPAAPAPEQPQDGYVAPQAGGSTSPGSGDVPAPVAAAPAPQATRGVAAVTLPSGMIALVALAQLGFLAAMAAAGLGTRAAAVKPAEWFFDTLDRTRPSR